MTGASKAAMEKPPKTTPGGEPMADDAIRAILARAGERQADPPCSCSLPPWDGEPLEVGNVVCDGRQHLSGPGRGSFDGLCSTNKQSIAAARVAAEEERLAAVLEHLARVN